MSMKRLWAPWRIRYVAGKKQKGCIFCAVGAARLRRAELIFSTRHSLCLMNIFPYNNGHLMLAPRRHVRSLSLLKDAELLDLMRALGKAERLLRRALKPDGFNIGINLSRAAGAGIPGHLHVHIVPRWQGDTNFMPVVTGTKIISQSLGELRRILKHAGSKRD